MHLDYISLTPFPTASSANGPAVPFKGCSRCVGTTTMLSTTITSSSYYSLLLGSPAPTGYHPLHWVPVQMPPLKMLIFWKYKTSCAWSTRHKKYLLGIKKFVRSSWRRWVFWWVSPPYLPALLRHFSNSDMPHCHFKCKLPHLLF